MISRIFCEFKAAEIRPVWNAQDITQHLSEMTQKLSAILQTWKLQLERCHSWLCFFCYTFFPICRIEIVHHFECKNFDIDICKAMLLLGFYLTFKYSKWHWLSKLDRVIKAYLSFENVYRRIVNARFFADCEEITKSWYEN